MEKLRVLLICGSGASSGFMAQNMRKAAAKKEINAAIEARSEAELDAMLDSIDVLMIGPHLKYLEDELIQQVGNRNVKVGVISQKAYGTLNGELALEETLALVK